MVNNCILASLMEAKRILVRPFNSLAFSSSSGAFYTDDTSGNKKKDDRIPYGFTKTVEWSIPEEFAPRDDDPNCLPMAYHSHNLPGLEINAGLIGLIIVCKPGNLHKNILMQYIYFFRT